MIARPFFFNALRNKYLDVGNGNVQPVISWSPTSPEIGETVLFSIDGVPVDLADDVVTYLVSTVNYLAAGSCNYNDAGVTLWPLDQIVADTQFYVRNSVIDYITAMGTISPAIEGRLVFLP